MSNLRQRDMPTEILSHAHANATDTSIKASKKYSIFTVIKRIFIIMLIYSIVILNNWFSKK